MPRRCGRAGAVATANVTQVRRGHEGNSTSLTTDQRRVVIAVVIAQLGILTLTASLNYVLPAMVSDFQATASEEAACRQISSIASLLVVFIAGVLGPRLGERKVLMASAALFVVGSLIVAVAPAMVVVTLGLFIANVGKAILIVVVLALLTAKIRDEDGRATAFAMIATAVPMAYLVMPLVAGALVSSVGWRWVALIWVLCGLVAMGAIVRLLPKDGVLHEAGEMWTPALAGLALASGVQFISVYSEDGWTSEVAVLAITCVVSLVVLFAVYRRIKTPSLSIEPLRHGGLLLLLIIVILFSFTNLYYYNTLLYEISYGYSALGAAVIMIPTQCGSILGAVVARKLLHMRGITFTGGSMMILLGLTMLLAATVNLNTPLIWPVILVSFYALASVAAFVALTNGVMNLAQPGDEGAASAYKTAAGNVGGALGIALMTGVVLLAGTTAWKSEAAKTGDTSSASEQAAWSILEGTQPMDASSLYGIPIGESAAIAEEDKVAFMAAYQAQAIVGGVIVLLTTVLFFAVRRRHERSQRADMGPVTG